MRGGSFLGLNYGRLSRLRPVTGYPDAFDWTKGVKHPEDDCLFRVDVKTGVASGPLVEVFGDVRAGDEIAVRGTDEIRADTNVRAREVKPATL
jgi:hypothetical protein